MKRQSPTNAAAPEVTLGPSGCSWVSDRPCRFPAPFSHNTLGGPWWCPWHFRCSTHQHGAEITEASYRWDGRPESYLEMRRKQVYGEPKQEPVKEAA